MKAVVLFLYYYLFLVTWCQAQPCGFEARLMEDLAAYPALQQDREALESTLAKWMATNVQPRDMITIPVVIHIVWRTEVGNISDAQIQSQLDVLNQDYRKRNKEQAKLIPKEFQHLAADVGIEFCLANIDPVGNPTNGITKTSTSIENIGIYNDIYYTSRGGQDAWDTKRYLNIWVCELPKGLLGIGTTPMSALPEEDGIVIDYRYLGTIGTAKNSKPNHLGRTLTHEIGHYFNLLHPWGLMTDDCDEDDKIADTPFQTGPYFGCPSQQSYACNTQSLTSQFMDFSDDACMALFTEGQKARMLASLYTARQGLISNSPCFSKKSNLKLQLDLTPNPATNFVNINVNNFVNNLSVTIVNSLGQILYQRQVTDKIIPPIELEKFSPGFYWVFVKSAEYHALVSKKLVILPPN